jgi:glutaredoxin 3
MSKVIVYSQNQCAYCGMVKRYLGAKQVAYEEVNLDEKPELREYVQKISGASTEPKFVYWMEPSWSKCSTCVT